MSVFIKGLPGYGLFQIIPSFSVRLYTPLPY
jgi:hypothetical protein